MHVHVHVHVHGLVLRSSLHRIRKWIIVGARLIRSWSGVVRTPDKRFGQGAVLLPWWIPVSGGVVAFGEAEAGEIG